MPELNVSELNIVLSVLGAFIVLFGVISVKLKNAWYLGEALPAMVVGICLGPIAAKFLDSDRWGSQEAGQTNEITLGLTRVVISLQILIAGYQLPEKYLLRYWKEVTILMVPVMAVMWLCTTLCMLATIPKITLLGALVIASCVTCTDPVLSQAVAKGPFADKYVARPLRELISAEAGFNDGFGFPFLMLAIYLMRHANGVQEHPDGVEHSARDIAMMLYERASGGDVFRTGGGLGEAMKNWFVETWIYYIILSFFYGFTCGTLARYSVKYSLKRRWIDGESYVLFPTALGLFITGTCGSIGANDLLACFVAGNALNWDGEYLRETIRRHDEVNSCIDVLLNFGGFMYIGTILPWDQWHDPDGTGITIGRLFGLGVLVLILRRIPAILMAYKLMGRCCTNWKEAVFMGYFGPIGIGAVFYVAHVHHLIPEDGEGDAEQTNLLRALQPTVHWLVFFSIVVHGLSIPVLDLIYKRAGVRPIKDDAMSMRRRSASIAPPANAAVGDPDHFIAYNRFSRPNLDVERLPVVMDETLNAAQMQAYAASNVKQPNYAGEDAEGERKRAQRRTIRYGV